MAVGVQKAWSTTAATNASADSSINYAENQSPASLNDSARAEMAAIKAFANQITAALTSGGSANAQTITSDAPGAISTAYAAGMGFVFRAGYTNTGATTLNVDGVGAKSIKKGGALSALVANDIVAGGIYAVYYQATGDCFVLLNPETGQTAAGNQPLDATLTALAALSYTSGTLHVTLTAADTFTLMADTAIVHTTGAETVAGAKTFTSAPVVSLNAGSLPSATTGTVLRLAQADATATVLAIDAFGAGPILEYRRASGTAASPTTVTSGASLGGQRAIGYDGSAYTTRRAQMSMVASESWTGSAHGTYFLFQSTPTGSTTMADRYRMGDTTSTIEVGYRDGGPGSVPNTSYTFALTDRGTCTDHSSGSAHSYTVPPASSVAWPANSILMGCNTGAGALTIARGSGVVLRDAAGTDADLSVPQYGYYMLRRVASDVWYGRVY